MPFCSYWKTIAFIFVLFSTPFCLCNLSSTRFSRSVRSFSTVYQLRGFLARKRDKGGREKQSRESGELGIQAGVRGNLEFLTGIRARQKVRRYGATKVRFVAERTCRVRFARRRHYKARSIAQPPTRRVKQNLFLKCLSNTRCREFITIFLINVFGIVKFLLLISLPRDNCGSSIAINLVKWIPPSYVFSRLYISFINFWCLIVSIFRFY